MSSEGTHQHYQTIKGFMTEKDIWPAFEKIRSPDFSDKSEPSIKKWSDDSKHHPLVYGHHERIGGPDGYYDCNTIVDEWFKWFLTTPVSSNPHTNPGDSYGISNSFLLNLQGTRVYFTTAAPFVDPYDFKTITMTEQASLLVPVYNLSASRQDFFKRVESDDKLADPKFEGDDGLLKDLILKDLSHVETIEATFDGQSLHGCCVVRDQPAEFPIADQDNVVAVPQDRLARPQSKIHMCHGGFWLLIREEHLTAGDHLLQFKAKSRNYEMSAKILISSLVPPMPTKP